MKRILNVFTILLLSLNFAAAQNAFFICDTECHAAPFGDCDSGHTDIDNVEWFCDITFDDPNLTPAMVLPNDLEQMPGVVDPLDARPQIVNLDTSSMAVSVAFEDVVITGTVGFKILRTWTIVEWFSGQIFTRVQLIKNIADVRSNCDVMVCNNGLQVALAPGTPLSATIWATDILEGDYSLCDPQNFTIDIMDDAMQVLYSGVGNVTVEEEGSFTAVVTNPTSQNSCWATIIFEDRTSGCDTPFVVCDKQCNSAPVGDCDSGHTDTDNLEWPCDISINLPGVAAADLSPKRMKDLMVVSPINAEPTLVNYNCDLVAITYDDMIFPRQGSGYEIIRNWTVIDWVTGNQYRNVQYIENIAPQSVDCGNLACNGFINVALGTSNTNPIPAATLYVDAFLEGSYPNCDLDAFIIKIERADGSVMVRSVGTVTIVETGVFTYTVTDPSTGNSCWGQLDVENRSTNCDTPFRVCDTKCRTAPLGDCASGHTDSDNVEWPCDITIDAPGIEPQMLRVGNMSGISGIDQFDIQPILIDYNCNFVAWTYEDVVTDLGQLGFEISRKWTLVDWLTGNVFEYTQLIKNLAPGAVPNDCPTSLACRDVLSASLADNGWEIEFWVSDFLEGAYPNCDISTFQIDITDQVGSNSGSAVGNISMTTPGTFTYSITNPASGNACWGSLILSDEIFRNSSSTKEVSILSGVEVFPNPASETLNFDYGKLNLKGEVLISILDQSGRKLLEGKNVNQLNISDLSSGLYLYQIRMEDEIHHGKISVLK